MTCRCAGIRAIPRGGADRSREEEPKEKNLPKDESVDDACVVVFGGGPRRGW